MTKIQCCESEFISDERKSDKFEQIGTTKREANCQVDECKSCVEYVSFGYAIPISFKDVGHCELAAAFRKIRTVSKGLVTF